MNIYFSYFKSVVYNYDFYITFAREDENTANIVIDQIKKIDPDYKIYSEQQQLDPEKSWQDHIYTVV